MPEITTDADGRVRVITHRGEQFTASDFAEEAPRQLADEYLREYGSMYGLDSENIAALDAAPSPRPADGAGVQLQFSEEKTVIDTTVVSYRQTYLRLPVWQAGLDIRIHGTPPAVSSSASTLQYGIDAEVPPGTDLAEPDDQALLATALGLDGIAVQQSRVNSARYLVYQYDPDARTDPESQDTLVDAGAPTLLLPAISDGIRSGSYYVVREILFTLPLPGWGALNWRTLIEPTSETALYLRALVASATGCAFVRDPVTATGRPFTGCSPAAALDPLRTTVDLLGLDPPVDGVQNLRGHFVAVIDTDLPTIAPPTATTPYSFCYSATSDDFAATNAYVHYDSVYRLVDGMGFNIATYFDGTAFPVPVDHQGFGNQVNAAAHGNAAGNGMGRFQNGLAEVGCPVGIATDFRVVVHEFGHTLLWDHVNSPNFGWCHSAGDALGAILCDADSKSPDRFLTFPFVNIGRRHDRDVAAGWAWGGTQDNRQYGSEQILSTTMFRVYRVTGGDDVDLDVKRFAARYLAFLIIKAIGTLTVSTPNPVIFVNALMDADDSTVSFEGHPGGAWHKVIRWSFERQGLFQPAGAPSPAVQPGAPPAVDVYVDDGRAGGYEPFLADFADTTDVWNRQAADGGTTHQSARLGVPNHVYVRVRNRGTQAATGVSVKLFRADPAGALVWPTNWTQAGAALPVQVGLPAGGDVVVGPLAWTPQVAGQESLLVSVNATGDLSNADTVNGPLPHWRLVPFDNNLAQRTVSTVPAVTAER